MMRDKVTPKHLQQDAYLYIRQSSLRQVVEHSESTQRQYDLKERAIALGWPLEQIVTVDDDLGLSGAEATRRSGFQRLVSAVGMDTVGVVMGLEVSRLARNSSDWHRLLEICALTDTLILDEDGVYSPSDFNDRLILGLKGTMSEAELHYLKSRLQGGKLSKAKRGELKQALPVGLTYNIQDTVILDPDQQVQATLKSLTPSSGSAQRWLPCVTFTRTTSSFPDRYAVAHTRVNWHGRNSPIGRLCRSCITRATRAPIVLVEANSRCCLGG